jgi:hypothetical protein
VPTPECPAIEWRARGFVFAEEGGGREIVSADPSAGYVIPIFHLGCGGRGGDFLSESFFADVAKQYRQLRRLVWSYVFAGSPGPCTSTM